MISVIIVNWKKPEETEKCIQSLCKHADANFEIILINNESSEINDENRKLVEYSRITPYLTRVKTINNKENLGFVKAVNQGINTSIEEYILLLNNDFYVQEPFLTKLVNTFHSFPNTGITGPIKLFAEGTDFIEGSCLMIKKSLLNELGNLDERFGIGVMEDVDLAKRVQLFASLKLQQVSLNFIHEQAKTFGKELKTKQTETNRLIFRKKWAEIYRQNKDYVDVVCVNYRKDKMTLECLELFIKNANYPFKIYLVNNSPLQDTLFKGHDINSWTNTKKAENPWLLDIILYNSEENLGFLGGTNKGYSETEGKYICLLNNDAMVYSPFMYEYASTVNNNPKIGLIGPSRLETLGMTFLEDSLLFFTREFKDNILGEYDMDFGLGIFEDVLYCYQTKLAGYQVVHQQFDYKHLGSQTLANDKKIVQTDMNREVYKNKVFNTEHPMYVKLHQTMKERTEKDIFKRRLNND
jgi:GT2 family glycosyltransferase